MTRKTVIIVTALLIMFSNVSAIYAQEASTLPEPVRDALDLVKHIEVDISDTSWLKKFSEWGNEKYVQNSSWGDVRVNLQKFWSTANSWVYKTVGVTLIEIIKTVGSFFIWIVETAIEILKGLLSRL